MAWPVVPWALARFLVHITNKYRPSGGIIITENGVSVRGEENVRRPRPHCPAPAHAEQGGRTPWRAPAALHMHHGRGRPAHSTPLPRSAPG